MNVCIISGRYPLTNFESYINHKIYADKFGYSYIHCNWPTARSNHYFNKVVYVLSYLEFFDYIVWIDDDAFFFDFEKDIMQFAPRNDSFISFCKSPSHKELKTFLSSGQFIVKCNELSKRFFKSVLNTELTEVEKWWKEDLGYFTNGDQDIIIYLLLQNEDYKHKMDLYDYKSFNSRCENLFEVDPHKPFILHFTGRGKTKAENYKLVQQKLNLHPSLVSNLMLGTYNVKIKDNYNIAEDNPPKQSVTSRIGRKIRLWLRD